MGKRELVQRFGFRVVEMPHALKDPEWVRTHPRERAEDLHLAFTDPDIKAVFASIGGSDAIRVLPYLQAGVMAANPKVFTGYSDTAMIHLAAYGAGLQTFYGPSVMSGIAENGGMFAYAERWFRQVLMTPEPVGRLEPAEAWTEERLEWTDPSLENQQRALRKSDGWLWLQGEGKAEGHLLGGCLDTLEIAKGTRWWPPLDDWRGAVFFWETSEESPKPSLVERWLLNYAAQGILNVIAGMLVGRPRGYSHDERAELYGRLKDLLGRELGRRDLPVVAEMDFGHTDPMFILPYGARAIIDPERQEVVLPDPAVT
jgi:muramoyltetrapeptide carboxypeptidase LdcA involved in peptidoglycan recycling